MKTKLLFPFLIAVSLLLGGCVTQQAASAAAPVKRTKAIFNAPKDKVWPLLVGEVGLNYPVKAIEKESGLITTDFVTLPAGYNNVDADRWIRPLGGFLATWGGLRGNMRILVIETEPGKTMVTINCHYEALETNVTKSWIVGETNGGLEDLILTKIERQLPPAL